MNVIYRWTRTRYERPNTREKYIPVEKLETSFVTETQMLALTGDRERAFWRAIDARFVVRRGACGVVLVDNYSPDRLRKTSERFAPVDISAAVSSAGYRERMALIAACESNRPMLICDTMQRREVVLIGNGDTTAQLDVSTMEWVG